MTTKISETGFYFEVSEKAGMAHDHEGNDASCLCSVKYDFKQKLTPEQYEKIEKQVRGAISEQMNIPIEWLTPLTEEEYEERMDEED